MSTITPNMSLIQPTIGVDTGQTWEDSINSNASRIDQHNHSPGSGVPLGSSSLSINGDLSFNSYNAVQLRSCRFTPQISPLTLPSDLGCIYVSGADLYYRDTSGNNIQMTSGGAVLATAFGIISGSASASFVGSILTVFSAPNTPASIRAGSYLMGNTGLSGSNYLTLQPTAALGANYSLTLPSLPTVLQSTPKPAPLLIDTSGNIQPGNSFDYFMPAGMIMAYGGVTPPTGWLLCDGTAISRVTYVALFTAIGTAYGIGDGATTFNLPDCRGMFLRGVAHGSPNDPDRASRSASGTAGNTGDNVGSLQTSTFQTHAHTIAIQGISVGGGPFGVYTSGGSVTTSSVGGSSETRPINLYVNYIIKY